MWNFQCSVPTEEDGKNKSVLSTSRRLKKQGGLSKFLRGLWAVNGAYYWDLQTVALLWLHCLLGVAVDVHIILFWGAIACRTQGTFLLCWLPPCFTLLCVTTQCSPHWGKPAPFP